MRTAAVATLLGLCARPHRLVGVLLLAGATAATARRATAPAVTPAVPELMESMRPAQTARALHRRLLSCYNDDYSYDSYGRTCSDYYDVYSVSCGNYDDSDFTASEQCCACSGGYAANATFVVGPEGVDYAEADFFCTQIGAALATIADAAENELARQDCGGKICWLGLVKGETGLWHDASGTAAAYTNWEAGQPRTASDVHAMLFPSGTWYDGAADQGTRYDYYVYPLCRVVGDLNFTTNVHHPQQCQNHCGRFTDEETDEEGQTADEDCCAAKGWMSCADDDAGGTYQLVRTDDVCGEFNGFRDAYSFHCFPCKPGKTCDNGRGDDDDKCDTGCGGGCVAAIIIFFVVLPLCCIAASVAACVFACAQNQGGRAPVRPQPVAYGRPMGRRRRLRAAHWRRRPDAAVRQAGAVRPAGALRSASALRPATGATHGHPAHGHAARAAHGRAAHGRPAASRPGFCRPGHRRGPTSVRPPTRILNFAAADRITPR